MAVAQRAVPNNLPAPLTSFVGRKHEIAELCRLVRGTRLLTLTGGGCGKSRLAIEGPSRVLHDFPDGVYPVQLAGAEARNAIAAASGAVPDGARRNGLTRREREVASLIAAGLSNRQIEARLVIAERTADGHVQGILNKMGFNSQAQIAAWAVQRGVEKTPAK